MTIKSFLALIGSLGVLSLGVSCAKANIGDTARQSDLRYGRPSFGVAAGYQYRNYTKGNWQISTLFEDHGHCVYIQYSRVEGSNIGDRELAMLLNDNLIGNHQWRPYNGSAQYATWFDGGLYYAIYCYQPQTYPDGRTRTAPTLRITNQATLSAMGALRAPDAETATTADVNSI